MKKKNHALQMLEITLGVFLMTFAYYFFMSPANLISGGVTGITIIVKDIIPVSESVFILILNLILLIIGLIFIGREFFLKTVYASILFPLLTFIFEKTSTPDYILRGVDKSNWYFISMVVASILTAVGLGICFRNNATTGGMDIVQKIMTKYLHVPYSKTMYLTDWIIILLSGFFIRPTNTIYGIEGVVYGLISVLLMGYLIDYIALNAKNRRTAYIITTKPNEVKEMIFKKIQRGVTECDVRGGYTGKAKVMLICTLDTNESYKINDEVHKVDSEAFMFMSQTKEVVGEYL